MCRAVEHDLPDLIGHDLNADGNGTQDASLVHERTVVLGFSVVLRTLDAETFQHTTRECA